MADIKDSSEIITDIKKDILDNSLGRYKHYIVSTILSYMVLCNWKMIYYILFSSDSVQVKLCNYQTYQVSFCKGLILPISLALGSILLVPILNFGAKYILLKIRKGEIHVDVKLAKEKRNQEEKEARDMEIAKLKSSLESQEVEIKDYKTQLANLESDLATKNHQYNRKEEDYKNLEKASIELRAEIKEKNNSLREMGITREMITNDWDKKESAYKENIKQLRESWASLSEQKASIEKEFNEYKDKSKSIVDSIRSNIKTLLNIEDSEKLQDTLIFLRNNIDNKEFSNTIQVAYEYWHSHNKQIYNLAHNILRESNLD